MVWCVSSVAVVGIATTALFLGRIDQYVFRDLIIAFMAFTLSYFIANVWNKKITSQCNYNGDNAEKNNEEET